MCTTYNSSCLYMLSIKPLKWLFLPFTANPFIAAFFKNIFADYAEPDVFYEILFLRLILTGYYKYFCSKYNG